MKRTLLRKIVAAALFFVLSASLCSAADLLVPKMELISRGYLDKGSFLLTTNGNFDLSIAGGYKFGGRLVLNLQSDHLEDTSLDNSIQFKSASVTLRNLFNRPLSASYFVGSYATFCNGDIFPAIFGTGQIASRYRGYMYFPEGIIYDGIADVTGTGINFSTFSDNFITSAYLYQDSLLGDGKYSVDLHAALNFELLKLETFAGTSFPMSSIGLYRFGLFLFYKTGSGGEFLTQLGIPRWDPILDSFDIDLFYFLFEPRIKLNNFSVILTLFWHPGYYHFVETNELGSADININFLLGDPEKSPLSGGLESGIKFNSSGSNQFVVVASPYFSAITSGVIWNIKVNTKLFPFSLSDFIEFFIGLKAEF